MHILVLIRGGVWGWQFSFSQYLRDFLRANSPAVKQGFSQKPCFLNLRSHSQPCFPGTDYLLQTFIGRVERRWDFLGYRFAPSGLEVGSVTVSRFLERVSRLYEQGATASRIEEYARRWLIWVRSGVSGVALSAVKKFLFSLGVSFS